LTQAELAEQVNISSTHIGLIERGEKGASYELLEKLAHVFKVQIKDIFTGYLAVQDRLHDSIEEEYLDSIIFLLTKFDTKRLLFIKEFLENYQKTFEKN
jgi:transcriptional regulator with XRE-family HTH domain